MWCKTCNIETNESICPICGAPTEEEIPANVYWCSTCNVPVIQTENQVDLGTCPCCGEKIDYLASDMRPVFPEERGLFELLSDKRIGTYAEDFIWAHNNRYYVNGKPHVIPNSTYEKYNPQILREKLLEYDFCSEYDAFNSHVDRFVELNIRRKDYITDEAYKFIRETAATMDEEKVVISFSGGKDSTATADIVIKALGVPTLVHIFGDTTLEFPTTIEYAKRYRKEHPQAIFKIARNNEQVFSEVCEDIGPPARMMRWCCSMFKTGPITRVINSLYGDQTILTFYGIRKAESVSRSKYNRVEDDAESVKIHQQIVASPIFHWNDIDIWLYLLGEHVDFNEAYRLGYDRVGCWCCPNNNQRAQFLSKIYMPEESTQWRDFLVRFAKKIGKTDAETYVDTGKWKARQGGNGLSSAKDVKIKYTNCTTEENAKIYSLNAPFSEELIGLFVPFGKVSKELGSKLLNETLIVDVKTNMPIVSIQPFRQDGFDNAVKIKTMNVNNHDDIQRMVGYQIKKFNACRKCLKCESICRAGAISMTGDEYLIDPQKCVHCKKCMTAKYLDGGCTMDKYLRTK